MAVHLRAHRKNPDRGLGLPRSRSTTTALFPGDCEICCLLVAGNDLPCVDCLNALSGNGLSATARHPGCGAASAPGARWARAVGVGQGTTSLSGYGETRDFP